MSHVPVLLQPALHYLKVLPGHKYIDATLGLGGHTKAILAHGGLVLGLDQDPQALSACPDLEGLTKVCTNFSSISQVAKSHNWYPVDGIIFDLGMSSFQLDNPDRGFSFNSPSAPDMRMDNRLELSASQLILDSTVDSLAHILRVYGEIPVSSLLSRKIISNRPIKSAQELSKISGKWARQVFQALRIAVNDELNSISQALPQALEIVSPKGNLVIISFHSLEDRIIKLAFKAWQDEGLGYVVTPKPIIPSIEEQESNPRSHSAKLRVFSKK